MKNLTYFYQKYSTKKQRRLRRKKLKYCNKLNPKNEEAVFNLAKLKLKKSDFIESQKSN